MGTCSSRWAGRAQGGGRHHPRKPELPNNNLEKTSTSGLPNSSPSSSPNSSPNSRGDSGRRSSKRGSNRRSSRRGSSRRSSRGGSGHRSSKCGSRRRSSRGGPRRSSRGGSSHRSSTSNSRVGSSSISRRPQPSSPTSGGALAPCSKAPHRPRHLRWSGSGSLWLRQQCPTSDHRPSSLAAIPGLGAYRSRRRHHPRPTSTPGAAPQRPPRSKSSQQLRRTVPPRSSGPRPPRPSKPAQHGLRARRKRMLWPRRRQRQMRPAYEV
mmetsp:Transcript_67086/g.173905  ORF Transcript_67086/g.173905 Transcript_67086/m.173905 type:complete len:265 (-) Transcript_67086:301-1095(-)